VSCAAGMACKEPMVVAPVLVILYDVVFMFDSWREALRNRWRFYSALMLTWVILAGLLRNAGVTA